MKPATDDELFHMQRILIERGYAPEDFEASIEEPPATARSEPSPAFRPLIAVTRKSTKQTSWLPYEPRRSAWLIAFERQLVAGEFGKP
jgi:cytochrome oxidase assembly protein ShyY1